ncbi:MAG: MOSC domain-containing protein [Pyrinomonadaceae bacterium]
MDTTLFDKHLTARELEDRIEHVLRSPMDAGALELIVVRPSVGKRKVLTAAVVDQTEGVIGDNWLKRGSGWRQSKASNPEAQINVMNYRFALLVAGHRDRVPLAGDQLFVDLDLGPANLPPGTRLQVGSAIIEVTPPPHLGCKKFVERFGVEAMKFANSEFGRSHNLRGVNAKVVTGGEIAIGDIMSRQI